MENATFAINILPVGVGDCIHLRFFSKQKWYNIIIDSGPGAYAEQFWQLLSHIQKKGEQVDLLCFTHIDDDHILAAKKTFSCHKDVGDIVKTIWLNVPEYEVIRSTPLEPEMPEDISVSNALELYQYIQWYAQNKGLICQSRILRGDTLTFGNVTVTAVLPYEKRLDKFETWWVTKRPLLGNLENNSTARSDQSETNGSSIVLLIEALERRMLFTGDAFAVDLWSMAKQGVGFDLVKLPHHGSRSNITKRMLAAMRCRHFIISADGSCDRPAQTTVDLLGQFGQTHNGVILYSNYGADDWSSITEPAGVRIIPLIEGPVSPMDSISIRTEAVEL